MRFAKEHPEDWEERLEAMADRADQLRKERREAALLHDQEPGRWADWASPARMRRDIERDREEERDRD